MTFLLMPGEKYCWWLATLSATYCSYLLYFWAPRVGPNGREPHSTSVVRIVQATDMIRNVARFSFVFFLKEEKLLCFVSKKIFEEGNAKVSNQIVNSEMFTRMQTALYAFAYFHSQQIFKA